MVVLLLGLGCGTPADSPEPEKTANLAETDEVDTDAPQVEAVPGETKIEMRDVVLEQNGGLTRIRYLLGTVKPPRAGRLPDLGRPNGYSIVVDRAEVAV